MVVVTKVARKDEVFLYGACLACDYLIASLSFFINSLSFKTVVSIFFNLKETAFKNGLAAFLVFGGDCSNFFNIQFNTLSSSTAL